MKYFKSQDGVVFAFDEDQVAAGLAKDVIEMDEGEVFSHLNPPSMIEGVERPWRDAELSRADIELNKVQDGCGVGTVTAWRQYRVELRNWPEHLQFPAQEYRPKAPDSL